MKVRIDADLCTGCGLCTDSVPDVFKMGDDVAQVIKADVPANLEKAVKEATEDCPAEAIIIELLTRQDSSPAAGPGFFFALPLRTAIRGGAGINGILPCACAPPSVAAQASTASCLDNPRKACDFYLPGPIAQLVRAADS